MDSDKQRAVRKEVINSELYELDIYVQDYDLFISKQIGDVLPLLKSLPRFLLPGEEPERISLAS